MLIVKKQPGDSDDTLIKKFSRKAMDEQIVQEVRRRKYHLKPSAARAQKKQEKRRARLLARVG